MTVEHSDELLSRLAGGQCGVNRLFYNQLLSPKHPVDRRRPISNWQFFLSLKKNPRDEVAFEVQ
jgi:hypothetical protein